MQSGNKNEERERERGRKRERQRERGGEDKRRLEESSEIAI